VKAILPSRALALFLSIGFADLIITAILHAQGLATEVNPLMRVFIDKSEWLFVVVKGLTLLAGWLGLAWYAKTNPEFVKKVSYAGSAAYVSLWILIFLVSGGIA